MATKDVIVNGGAVLELHINKEEKEEEEDNEKNKVETEEKDEQEQQQLPYLDEAILTKILTKVDSAESLYNSLRYVCKSWYNIIFHNPDIHLNSLLPSKPPCLIIQNEDESSLTFYKTKTEEELLALSAAYDLSYTSCSVNIQVREGGVVEQQVHDLTPILKKMFIRACCNGLMLATPSGSSNLDTLCVFNPLTNHRLMLPPRPIDTYFAPVPVGFIFLPRTRKYKVVTAGHRPQDQTPHNLIQVLTLSSSPGNHCSNTDDPSGLWRLIEAPQPLFAHPLLIHGVLYWFLGDTNGEDYLVSFDASAEFFYTTRHSLFFHKKSRGFIEIGGYLAFWYFLPDKVKLSESRTFHVHVIEDLHKPGAKWKVLHGGVRMDMDFIKARHVRPVLSIGNGEVIIFYQTSRGALWAYNFRSQRWWRVGHCLKEWDALNFSGFHVKSSTPVPFDSLFSTL